MTGKKKPKERYVKLHYDILHIRGLGLCEKVLLAYIYSFGEKGCWQSNATLAEMFMTSPCTISRWIAKIRKYLHVKSPKGYYRTMWAKSHPDVASAVRLWHRGKKITKPQKNTPSHCSKRAKDPTQECASDLSKSTIRLTQECVTINNKTIRETIPETTAAPSPLPAGGAGSALLSDRKEQAAENIQEKGGGRLAPLAL